MTGKHIQEHRYGSYTYLNHKEFESKCRLFSIGTYIQRGRETLRQYIETYRKDFLQEAMEIINQSRNANKILWWKQDYMIKEDMSVITNF